MAAYAEQEIINGCLKKDRKYEEHLYKQYYGMFLAICMRYAKDVQNAKQLLNDGFVKIFMSIGSFRSEGSFEGWMKRIMVNTCLEYVRSGDFKKSSQTVHKDVMDDKDDMVVYNEAIAKIDSHELIMMIQALPPVSRTVFNLFVFDGYSHNEIATLLNITTGTSSWHMHNARTILQQKIMIKDKQYEHK